MVLLIYTDYSQNTLNISKLKSYIQNQNNIIKNYKIMCELLNEKVSGGGSTKKAQINRWKRYFEFHRDGQKYIIDKIYNNPLIAIDQRTLRPFVGEEKFLVSFEDRHSKGVYIIQEGNNVYIGSTYSEYGFLRRFIQHHNKPSQTMSHTRELINRPNATFKILYLAQETDTENIIRQKEADYIQEYMSNPKYNVINKRTETANYFIPNTYKKKNDKKGNKKYVAKDINIEYDIRFNKKELEKINKNCKSNYEIVYISSSTVFMKKIIAKTFDYIETKTE
jgi:hypothetical protein